MQEYIETNKRHWDEVVPIHERSEMYDVESFKRGNIRLHPLEREEVGDVAGKSLLHLQCHFGLDTLSWAKLGATVTGIDFSPTAIATATRLADETDTPARFIESDVYALSDVLDEQFDIVFTSYGALIWLPDTWRWAEIVARYVKPGGFFYIAEAHPMAHVFDTSNRSEFVVQEPYFTTVEPSTFDDQGTYADKDAIIENTVSHEWSHPIGDVVTALIQAGLRIDFLHEHPFCSWQMFPFMEQDPDGYYWRLTAHEKSVPLMYSLKATRPA